MIINVYNDKISDELISEIRKFDSEGISDYLSDPFTFTTGIVFADNNKNDKNNEKIIAVGILRVVNELKVSFKSEISNISKAMALKLLLKEINKRMHCNEGIALITNGGNYYVDILKNHFDFQEDPGIFLRLERKN